MFKTLSGKELYRVGDCLISVNAENPAKNFGGKWELLCPGRTLVCVDTSQSEFNALKKTGGEKTHVLSTSEMPSHSHSGSSVNAGAHTPSGTIASKSLTGHFRTVTYYTHGGDGIVSVSASNAKNASMPSGSTFGGQQYYIDASHNHTFTGNAVAAHNHAITIGSNGSGQAHNNLQPFMAVYIWVRVA